jgi:hypothetical protein
MKVMNYTSFMNKTFHPLLTDPTLGALDTLGSLSAGLGFSDPYSQALHIFEDERTLALIKGLRVVDILQGNSTLCVAIEGTGHMTAQLHDHLYPKAAGAAMPSKWYYFTPEFTQPAFKTFKLSGKTVNYCTVESADPKDNSEIGKVADLRKEVEGLKQQVAVLTGLVNLRAEPVRDPLGEAKSRGASYIKNELANPDNLNLASASAYCGRSDRTINLERQRGWLYALVLEGNSRGYRYPKWQFDVPASRLRLTLDILTPSGLSCWAIHNFLMRPHSDLDGKSPATALADSTFPIERVADLARRRVDQQQGAS